MLKLLLIHKLKGASGQVRFYRQVGENVIDRTRLPEKKAPDVQALSETAAEHGITIVGPPPGV